MKEVVRERLRALNAALAAADYERARAALEGVCEAVQALIATGTPEEALASELRCELERNRRLILAARAHDAGRLARMRRPPSFYVAGANSPHAVSLEA
ncbi:MAG: hypothetical protein RMI94_15685 [Bryobacterales bacterium]|nr:hypothetical protein [Bryobacteraceae bacterium]MDW8131990.1 hypothetical protein [Bryobacterales bacterium]